MKYKRCCLPREATPAADTRYERFLRTHKALVDQIMDWSVEHCPGSGSEAMQDFYGEAKRAVEETDMQLFIPYLLWKCQVQPGVVIGASFLKARGHRLSGVEREFLEEALRQPIRFLDVVSVEAGVGMRVRDIFTGSEAQVEERTASQSLRAGDILFAQIVCVEGIHSLEAFGPMALPPNYKHEIVALRRIIEEAAGGRRLDDGDLEAQAEDLRDLYFDLVEKLQTPPKLQNTDGDPLMLHRMSFRVPSAEAAFAKLSGLAQGHTEAELLEEAELDEDGKLCAVEWPWLKLGNKLHPSWDNTILGKLRLRGQTLTAEVNSTRRARRLRSLIEKRMGGDAVFEADEKQSGAAMMAQVRRERSAAPEVEPEAQPELDAAMREFRQQEMARWLDRALPILQGNTPREAVATRDGREIVLSLFADAERRDGTRYEAARRELGLEAEP